MSAEEYSKALKLGKKSSRASLLRGESPYLPVLEPLLKNLEISAYEPLGTMEIPLEQIVGTYYAGRQPSFTHDFLPLMPEGSEFALKWAALCTAHLNEGISDPIIAYEFMNHYYVVEGHKRVSILKYFNAVSVRATVTRVLPKLGDSEHERLYSDYLDFYKITGVNFLQFSRPGDYMDFLKLIDRLEYWTEEDRISFHSFYASFRQAFLSGQYPDSLSVGDAMLVYFHIYKLEDCLEKTSVEISHELSRMSDELNNRVSNADINLILKPSDRKPSFFSSPSAHLKVTFIHDKTADTSSWIYGHEIGRRNIQQTFGDQLETVCIDSRDTDESAEQAIEQAIEDHSDLIFTTSPRLLSVSVKAALEHPKANILNCSLNTSHPSIRTYYIRMYEAKFIMGAIAGSLTTDNKIGYIADYPIYSIAANINAFALGARMVNPNAKVILGWSETVDNEQCENISQSSVSYISDKDMLKGDDDSMRRVGLYHTTENGIVNTALSFVDWGRMYEKIIKTYLNGWKKDAPDTRAINYWWGMDADMIKLICSRSLPAGTSQLVDLLQTNIKNGKFHPFSTLITTQSGEVLDFRKHPMTPGDIITMDWLAENVIGRIPAFEELLPEAQALVRIQGLDAI